MPSYRLQIQETSLQPGAGAASGEGKIYISARSIDEVNVQVMMEKLGGGGHRTIAGAQLPGATIEEAKEKVKGVIDMMLEKGEI